MTEITIFEKDVEELNENQKEFIALHNKALHSEIMACSHIYELSNCLKAIYDNKYFLDAGFKKLEEYTEAYLGIKKSHAYNLIKVANTYSSEFFQLIGKNVDITKLITLSKLGEEGAYEFISDHDVESITVKKLKEQISKLEEDKAELQIQVEELELENTPDIDELENAFKSHEPEIVEKIVPDPAVLEELEKTKKELEETKNKITELSSSKDEIEIDPAILKEYENLKENLESTNYALKSVKEKLLIKEEEIKKQSEELNELKQLSLTVEDYKKKNDELNKKLSLANNQDFNIYKVYISSLDASINETRSFIDSIKDSEFKIKCIDAFNSFIRSKLYE